MSTQKAAMKIDDAGHADILIDSFARWYKSELRSYVDRIDPESLTTDANLTGVRDIVWNVSQVTFAFLMSELKNVGVPGETVLEHLRAEVSRGAS